MHYSPTSIVYSTNLFYNLLANLFHFLPHTFFILRAVGPIIFSFYSTVNLQIHCVHYVYCRQICRRKCGGMCAGRMDSASSRWSVLLVASLV